MLFAISTSHAIPTVLVSHIERKRMDFSHKSQFEPLQLFSPFLFYFQISKFARDLRLNTNMRLSSFHRRFGGALVDRNALRSHGGAAIIRFRIIHIYSPVHFKVIINQRKRRSGKGRKLRPNISDIYLHDLASQRADHSEAEFFQQFFDRKHGTNEYYEATLNGTEKGMLKICDRKVDGATAEQNCKKIRQRLSMNFTESLLKSRDRTTFTLNFAE